MSGTLAAVLFAVAITAVDVAIYAILFAIHGLLDEGFSFHDSIQFGGLHVFVRVAYLQPALLCAVVPLLAVMMVLFNVEAASIWRIFVPKPDIDSD